MKSPMLPGEHQATVQQALYQQEGKRLISVYPADPSGLDALLHAKLRLFGFTVDQTDGSR
jgi:hypothetical protein